MSARDFLRSFFQDHKTVGAVRETGSGVARRICALADVENAERVAELGCGTGPITRVILDELAPDGILWGFEVHDPFVEHVRQSISDSRFRLFAESATELVRQRRENDLPPFNSVISTIPFSYLTIDQTREILHAVVDSLADDGTFVALQYHPTYLPPKLRQHFDSLSREVYLWNLPPANLLTARNPRRL